MLVNVYNNRTLISEITLKCCVEIVFKHFLEFYGVIVTHHRSLIHGVHVITVILSKVPIICRLGLWLNLFNTSQVYFFIK